MAGALDYDSIIPLYTQVVDILRQNIQEGVFDNKKKLPAEEELIAQYNVSRITIRKSLFWSMRVF